MCAVNLKIINLTRFIQRVFFSFGLVLGLSACGGGSAGSGASRVTEVRGVIISAQTGLPLSDIEVKVLETGDSSVTDFEGEYHFYTDIPEDGVLTFTFDGVIAEQQINLVAPQLSSLPRNTDLISAEWLLDSLENSVSLIDINIE